MRLGSDMYSANGGSSADLDLRGIGQAIWRKRRWIVLPTVAAALLSVFTVMLMTPRYKSEARILIEGRESVFVRPEAERGDRERATVDAEAVQSQVQLVLSKDLAAQVVRQLKLGGHPEFDPVVHGFSPFRFVIAALGLGKDALAMPAEERVLEAYYNRLTVYPVDKSRVIAIEFTSADPDLAARVANTIAETYLAMQQRVRQEQTRAAGRWLAGEIETLRGKVADAEARVEDYRAKSSLFIGTNNTTLPNQQLGELSTQLSAARAQRSDMEARARLIRDLLRRGTPIEASEVLNSELVRRLAEQRATLRAQLAEQSSTLLDQHPRIKELRAQILEIDRQIKAEADKIARAFETDARFAGARVENLSAGLDQLKKQAAASNDQDVRLRSLDREARAQRELLESYLAKYREATARESLGSTPGEARVISNALVSNTPAFPKKLPIIFVATLTALFLSSGIVASGELMRAAATASGLRVPDGAEAAHDAVSRSEESSPVMRLAQDERIRNLRNAERADEDRDADRASEPPWLSGQRAVAVFSASQNGASAAAAEALARRMSATRRVAIIDCVFDGTGPDGDTPGLAELVRGECSFADIITRDADSAAHRVTAGRIGPEGDAIWESERLGTALDALVRSYDFTVLDAGTPTVKAAPRIARLSPRALLVGGQAPEERVIVAHERMMAAGFIDVVEADGDGRPAFDRDNTFRAPRAA